VELIFWWMLPLWLAALVAAVAIAAVLARRSRRRTAASLPIAHRDRLTGLPGYTRALRRYRRLLLGLIASLLVLLAGVALITARPASVSSVQPKLSNRDIVLCLDVSGSMVDYDKEVLDVFGELAEQFTGERISLVVFNASAVTRFPLTSDYEYIAEQFADLREDFDSEDSDYYRGTLFGNGSSLVGDGLASCVVRFDAPDAERSRSVILVTDNLIAGEPIFTLPEAGTLAQQRDVTVFGINPGDTDAKAYLDDLATEFRTVVEGTQGSYFALDDPRAIPSIVEQITAQQAAEMVGEPQIVLTDKPAVPVLIAFLGLAGLFVFAWRLRR
jgi:Ca-activated chloride channel family protein